jgi:hypothetical protein
MPSGERFEINWAIPISRLDVPPPDVHISDHAAGMVIMAKE